MQLSTRGRYAARAVLELALHYPGGPVRLHNISKNQDIPLRYLEQIMTMLVTSGLVKSKRGQAGGFNLAKLPSEISLYEVIQVVEGSLALVDCVDKASACLRSSSCITRDIWNRLSLQMKETLSSITLTDMVKMHQQKQANPGIPVI